MKNLLRLSCIVLLLSTVAASAKTLTVVNYTPFLCGEVQQTVNLLNEFPNPENWQMVVVCSRESWEHLRSKFKAFTESAFTLRSDRITFVNAAIYKRNSASQSRFVLAHEAGHLICRCNDERQANEEANKLLGENPLLLMSAPRQNTGGGRPFVK